MHTCAYCGRTLPWLHRVVGQLRFCSREHARLHGALTGAAEAGSVAGRPWTIEQAEAPGSLPERALPERTVRSDSGAWDSGDDFESGTRPAPPVEPGAGRGDDGRETPCPRQAENAASGADRPRAGCEDKGAAAAVAEPGNSQVPLCWHMFPLPEAAPMAAEPACLLRMPPRAPRRRILVPSHRPQKTPRRLPLAEAISSSFLCPLEPVAGQPGLHAGSLPPAFAAEIPALPRTDRPDWPASGRYCAEEPAMMPPRERQTPMGLRPVPPAGPSTARRLPPLWFEAASSAPGLSRPRPAIPVPIAGLRCSVSPLSLPVLKQDRQLSLAGLMQSGIQPFRLHRPPQRPLRFCPGFMIRPEPLRHWPRPVRPADSYPLFVPCPTAMPIRPSYAFGPSRSGESLAGEASGPLTARHGLLTLSGRPARE